MKVKMRATWASPTGVHFPGSVVEVDESLGDSLIAAGSAELVMRDTFKPAPPPVTEEVAPVKQVEVAEVRKKKIHR